MNRLHGRHRKGRGGGGGEEEKGMGKQFSPYPPSLHAMQLLAGGNFCTCIFMLVVPLFLRQIFKGPLVVFISLYHYTNFRFIINPKSGNFLPDGVWAFVMKPKSMMKQTQSYCTWWVVNHDLFFLFWSLNLFSRTCQITLYSHSWKLQCICKSWDFKSFIVIM